MPNAQSINHDLGKRLQALALAKLSDVLKKTGSEVEFKITQRQLQEYRKKRFHDYVNKLAIAVIIQKLVPNLSLNMFKMLLGQEVLPNLPPKSKPL